MMIHRSNLTARAACLIGSVALAVAFLPQTSSAAEVSWFLPLGGDFSASIQWTGGVVPGPTDDAVFDLNALSPGYQLFLSVPTTNNRLIIRDDDVRINTATLTYTLLDPTLPTLGTPSIVVGQNAGEVGELMLVGGGTLAGQYMSIGLDGDGSLLIVATNNVSNTVGFIGTNANSTGSVRVSGNGSWTNSDNLFVGLTGTGTLSVEFGGSVSNTFGFIGRNLNSSGMVTVKGTGSTWTNSNDLFVGRTGTGILNIEAGGVVSNAEGNIARVAGSMGTATVTGTDSTWTNTDSLYVGGSNLSAGGTGTLNVQNNAAVTVANTLKVWDTGTVNLTGGSIEAQSVDVVAGGTLAHTGGTLTVKGGSLTDGNIAGDYSIDGANNPNLVLDNATFNLGANELRVGDLDQGTLNIEAGAQVSNSFGLIGNQSGSTGTATVTGSDASMTPSTWAMTDNLFVGNIGDGTLNIQAGGTVSNAQGFIAGDSNASGTTTVSGAGSEWTNTDELFVGDDGTGTLNIQDGGTVTNTGGFIGVNNIDAIGTVTVTGTDSEWANSSSLNVGNVGTGTLNVEAGATVTNTDGIIGNFSNSTGIATVTGTDSKWTNSGSLDVGSSGTGTLNVEAGGSVSNSFGRIGQNTDSTVTVTGAGSMWTNSSTLFVHNGTLNIEDGGAVSNGFGNIAEAFGTTGTVNVLTGATWTSNNRISVGNEGNGTLNIMSGGDVISSEGSLGLNQTGVGTATVAGAGSTWTNNGSLSVGDLGNGTLNIQDGGTVTNTSGTIAKFNGKTGTVTVTGTDSTWTNSTTFAVGLIGTGILNIEDGGTVTNTNGFMGSSSTSTSTVTVTGTNSKWTNSGELTVGNLGTGILNIQAGGTVSNTNGFIANNGSTSTVTVTGTNSTWSNTDSLYVGGSSFNPGGTGTLNIQAGGTVEVANSLTIWNQGTVNLNGGTIIFDQIDLNAGSSFNFGSGSLHSTGNLTVNSAIYGNTAPPLSPNRTLTVDGTATLATPITLDGGTFTSGSISNYQFINFLAGTINLTGGTLTGTIPLNLPSVGTLTGSGSVNTQVHGVFGSTITPTGNLTLGDSSSFFGFNHEGILDVGAHTVTLNSASFATLGSLTTLNGGTINAPNGVFLGGGKIITGSGSVNAAVSAGFGSTINATGNLTLGDTTAVDGFFSDGRLFANNYTVTINDANEAVLGSLTTLGDGAGNAGTLAAANGLVVEFGKNVTGFGTIDTPDDVNNPLINNGFIGGNSAAEQITLNGYVKGVGTFSDVVFNGTFAPGLSPTDSKINNNMTLGNAATLEIELGGTDAGSEHDKVTVTQNASLDGTLKLIVDTNTFTPSYGNTFEILAYGTRTGTFDEVTLNDSILALQTDLALAPVYDFPGSSDPLFADTLFAAAPDTLTLFTTLPGDANLDLRVEDADLSLLLTNFGNSGAAWTGGDFTGDGVVDDADLSLLLTNFGGDVRSLFSSGLAGNVATIPEPATLALLSLGCLLIARQRAV